MTLLATLHAELLKTKRTIAMVMVVLAPALIAMFVFFMAANAPFSTLHRNGIAGEWAALTRMTLRFWASMMLPLFITLETALVAGLDHSENHWKSLFARPVPRWSFYLAKLIVVMAMVGASTALLAGSVFLTGTILPHVQSQTVFGLPIPWTEISRQFEQVMALAFLVLAIQHWIGLRWRAFSVAFGAGIVGLLCGFFAYVAGQQGAPLLQYFPWSLPMLILSRTPPMSSALWFSLAGGIVISAAGCWEFSRREIQ